MAKRQHKETRNVMKQDIQFLVTYREICHENCIHNIYAKFLLIQKYRMLHGEERSKAERAVSRVGVLTFLILLHGTKQNITLQTPGFILLSQNYKKLLLNENISMVC